MSSNLTASATKQENPLYNKGLRFSSILTHTATHKEFLEKPEAISRVSKMQQRIAPSVIRERVKPIPGEVTAADHPLAKQLRSTDSKKPAEAGQPEKAGARRGSACRLVFVLAGF
ncbi:hypothetical protein N5I84_03410 [Ralstonia sp. CHL-2022]|uniref:hypothetical protein n=1 Tax=Ralstonia mojiangensis TaxID=2953895 RepID=UPI0021B30747|nr:hypothetical protein [Ralstonia mojiangensis]MCT7295205.1 hypothetical protein [Ralstonia mojiangensis]